MFLELASINQFEIKIAKQPRDNLVNLKERQVATDAKMTSTTELCPEFISLK